MPDLLDEHGKPINPSNSEESGGATEAKPEVDYAKSEDVTALRAQLSGMTETLAEMRGAMSVATQPQAAAPVTPAPEITDAEINQALSEGENPAAKLRSMLNQATKAVRAESQAEMAQFRAVGTASLTELTAVTAAQLPHFKAYEKEIRTMIAQLPGETQTDIRTWKLAHDAVVGQHNEEIVAREIDAERRRSRDEAASPSLPGSGQAPGQADGGSKVPTVEDWGGAEARAELQSKGQTEDEYAKKLGYKGWGDYMEKFQETVAKEKEFDDGRHQRPAWIQ